MDDTTRHQPSTHDTKVVPLQQLRTGDMVQANDGTFRKVVTIDPVIDPRSGVYEADSRQAVVRLASVTDTSVTVELLQDRVTVAA